MALEIVEEGGPVGLYVMHLEIAERKREAVVYPDQHRWVFGQPLDKPFGDAAPRPVFAWATGGITSTGDDDRSAL